VLACHRVRIARRSRQAQLAPQALEAARRRQRRGRARDEVEQAAIGRLRQQAGDESIGLRAFGVDAAPRR
jgi:hypothetical protein